MSSAIFYTIDVIAYNYCDHILSNQGRTIVEVSTYNLYAIMLYAIAIKDENIGFDGYISNWILRIYRIYRRYIGGYFYMNIDISEINKNTLKLIDGNTL